MAERVWLASRLPAAARARWLSDQESLQVDRRVVEAIAPQAVVHDRTGLDDRDQAGGPELDHVVLDGWLRQLELLGDLGEIQVAGREQLEDSESRAVAEGAMEAEHRERGSERILLVQRLVGDRIAEEPPILAGEQEVERSR